MNWKVNHAHPVLISNQLPDGRTPKNPWVFPRPGRQEAWVGSCPCADGVTASTYKLIRATTDGSASANYIEASFTKSAGSTMTAGAATITGTGTGSAATAGTITGSIAASQTGKTAGTFSKTMTLNIVY